MKKTVSTIFALLLGFLPFFGFVSKASAYTNSNYYSFSGLTPMEEITEAEIDYDDAIFVSPDGNDGTGDGTLAKPYKTVNKAIAEASNPIWDVDCNITSRTPTTIYLRDGTYPENVVINKDNITLRNYPGETARVTGGGLTTYNANIYIMKNLSNIRVYGLNIEDRHEEGIEGAYGVLIRGGTSNIIIQNNVFKNIHANAAAFDGTYGNNATGVIIYGDQETVAHNILIANNEFTDIECGLSEVITVNGYTAMVDVIENYIHDVKNIGIDIAGHYGANSDPDKDYARYVYVAGNRIDNAVSDVAVNAGIYVDGAKNVLVERNSVTNSPMGISIGEESEVTSEEYATEGIIISSNFLKGNNKGSLRIGTSPSRSSTVINSVVINNTIVNEATALGAPIIIAKSHDNKILNNVVIDEGTWNGLIHTDGTSGAEDIYNYEIDYNYFFAYAFHMWYQDGLPFNIANVSYAYNDFNNSGYGSHNVYSTDALDTLVDANYSIVAGSALEGAGTDYDSDWLRDFDGNLRDNDHIDLGYIANNTRGETAEDTARLTAEFPFERNVLSNLVYGAIVTPNDITVPEGTVCPYYVEPEEPEPTTPEEPAEEEEELAVPDTGAGITSSASEPLELPENYLMFGVVAGVSIVIVAGIYIKARD